MTASINRSTWLRLYKNLFAEANKFNSYNYREYAKRRVRDHFRTNASERNTEKLQSLFDFGQRELASLRRQTVLVRLYAAPKLIIENLAAGEKVSKELGNIGKSPVDDKVHGGLTGSN